MRRSPRMIAGCIRETIAAGRLRLRARRAIGLSSPSASISSAPRSITSAASLPSTAWTKALLTRPSLRSGPRYHIGKGAASITWVSELSAASVCRSRSASLARSSSPALTSTNHSSKRSGRLARRRGPPRTSNTRPEPLARTLRGHTRPPRRGPNRSSRRKRLEILRRDTAVIAGEIGKRRRRRLEAKVAHQLLVGLDPPSGANRQAAAPASARAGAHWRALRRAPAGRGGNGARRLSRWPRQGRATAAQAQRWPDFHRSNARHDRAPPPASDS